MSLKLAHGFSIFKATVFPEETKRKAADSSSEPRLSPTLRLYTDERVYRPGDLITATVEICNPRSEEQSSLLVDKISFEVKGIEKLDSQWFYTRKPLPGSKQRRGERLFVDCTTPTIISKQIISSGSTKTYMVRAELPKILPPSYRGTSIRYIYYIRTTLCGQWVVLENGHCDRRRLNDLIQLEARVPLQIWAAQKSSNLLNEGNLSATTIQMDIYWKEKGEDSEWARANELSDEFEEGYDSSKDEVSSVSSYNPARAKINLALRKSLSLQSMASRLSTNEYQYPHDDHSKLHPYSLLTRLSVSEVTDDTGNGLVSSQNMLKHSPTSISSSEQRTLSISNLPTDDKRSSPQATGSHEAVASEGFIRGRSYNIRIDDQVLLRFSPKNSDSTYYFGDMIGGTLTFFHGGIRRCLEVSITLETSETISQKFVHPSRRSIPTITKIQSDHHEVVADLVQSSFLFSIPIDGPVSFSTPYISVQWLLRFEFLMTPKNVDLNRYEHPLLVKEREKGDWILPITVCTPIRTQHARAEKPVSFRNLFQS